MSKQKKMFHGYDWNNVENCKDCLNHLIIKHGIVKMRDFRKLRRDHFIEIGASTLLFQNYSGNMLRLFRDTFNNLYEGQNFLPFHFPVVPDGYWDNSNTHKLFFDDLLREEGLRYPEGVYALTNEMVNAHGGETLLQKHYGSCLTLAVSKIYNEDGREWYEWFFSSLPNNFLDNPKKIRRYLSWFAKEHDFDKDNRDAWKGVSTSEFKKNCGGGLINKHKSPYGVLKFARNDLNLHQDEFKKAPNYYWACPAMRRIKLLNAYESIGLKNLKEDIYTVTQEQVYAHGARGMIVSRYGGSHIYAALHLLPELKLKIRLFAKAPQKYWKLREHRRQLLHEVLNGLGYNGEITGFHNITRKEICLFKGGGMLATYYNGSPKKAIMDLIDNPWQEEDFNPKSKRQRLLCKMLRNIFPNIPVKSNCHNNGLFFKIAGSGQVELDIYFPSINLAYEYQGEQHYRRIAFFQTEKEFQQLLRRDEEKKLLCIKAGITLIIVPYWTAFTIQNLAGLTAIHRPDLIKTTLLPDIKKIEEVMVMTT